MCIRVVKLENKIIIIIIIQCIVLYRAFSYALMYIHDVENVTGTFGGG